MSTKTLEPFKITRPLVTKLLETVDAGLCAGNGMPEPGKMCVEAAVCYALGLPHSDDPPCVSRALRSVKIALNDSEWSSNKARAKGMRKLAVAQLGTIDTLDDVKFTKKLTELTIRKMVPRALRVVAALPAVKDHAANLEACAVRCEKDGNCDAARAASYAARAASYAASARDVELTFFANLVLEVLIALKVPGVKWLKYVK